MALKISRILHAGYVFESVSRNGDLTQIAFDPIFENPFSRNCYSFPEVEFDLAQISELKFSAVFISHYHDDHCSFESLNLLDRETPIYIYCLHPQLLDWIRELGFKKVTGLSLNAPVQVGAFTVTPRRALDEEVDSLFQIQAAGLNVLNVVDSWIDDETLELLQAETPWDLILWPFQTMRELEVLAPSFAEPATTTLPPEWIEQLRALAPRFVVPSSCQFLQEPWSWYNRAFFPVSYSRFTQEIEKELSLAKVIRLDPSASIQLSTESLTTGERLPWVTLSSETVVDYEYDPELKPPPTAEISRRFPQLTDTQFQVVSEFIAVVMPRKFAELEASEDPYFSEPRIWELSVFDHLGQVQRQTFWIKQNKMNLVDSQADPEWRTEVPAAKLFAALNQGESLTSMYVRINDGVFPEALRAQLREADITQDPLVRCLFTGAFGSYQLAQLREIQARTKV